VLEEPLLFLLLVVNDEGLASADIVFLVGCCCCCCCFDGVAGRPILDIDLLSETGDRVWWPLSVEAIV